jgi:hypothetical protein
MIDYMLKAPRAAHKPVRDYLSGLSREQQVKAVVVGVRFEGDRDYRVAPIWLRCTGWTDRAALGGRVLRYEDLPNDATARLLAGILGVPSTAMKEAVAQSLQTRTSTFNVGRAGRWREEMTPDLLAHFCEHDGGAVEALGYSWSTS